MGDLSRRCSDTDGVKKVCEDILSNKAKYDPILQQFIVKLPIKVFHYVASYMLKGYIMDMEDMRNKAAREAEKMKAIRMARLMIEDGKLSYEDIAMYTELTLKEVEKIAMEKKRA